MNDIRAEGTICYPVGVSAKLAALLFEKVYAGSQIHCEKDRDFDFENMPEDVKYYSDTIDEEADDEVEKERNWLWGFYEDESEFDERYAVYGSPGLNALRRTEAGRFYRLRGISLVPLFASPDYLDFEYDRAEPSTVYQAVLRNLPGLDTSDTPWRQVVEFRQDNEALRKLRALNLWLHDSLESTSEAHFADVIGKKIEDYEWAIKKHGLKTLTGTIAQLVDPKTLASVGALAGAGVAVGGVSWGALLGGITCLTNIGVYLAERAIDRRDVQRGDNSEIAYIHEIRKHLS